MVEKKTTTTTKVKTDLSTVLARAGLTPLEEKILRMRYGIGLNADEKLEYIIPKDELDRQALKAIEAKAVQAVEEKARKSTARKEMLVAKIGRPKKKD